MKISYLRPGLILATILMVANYGCFEFNKKKSDETISTKSLNGNWQLYDLSGSDTNQDIRDDKLLRAARDKEIIKEGMIISFFDDDTYTELSGSGTYNTGKWQYDGNKTIHLSNAEAFHTVSVKQEIVNSRETMELTYTNKRKLKFIHLSKPLEDYHEDPFYNKNNLWRIKPSMEENSKQIQERLANYFKHIAYILKAATERKENVVSFQFSLGIVKIYDGGIGIYPLSVIPKTWMNTYYNEADAKSAYNMFRNYLMTHSYGGAGIGNWIEDDYNILLSIYGDAEQGKFATSASE